MKDPRSLVGDAPGATPLDPDEAEGLLPSHVTTREQLNAWEQMNIAEADVWATSRRRRASAVVLSPEFAENLHRRMFNQTWLWAGTYRRSGKNIGLPANSVRVALRDRLADAGVWLAHAVFDVDEIAARLHHQLVVVHPWPNGNGRWARIMADSLLHAERRPRFSWGVGRTDARAAYLASLKAADRGNLGPLRSFVRS
ncbi:MAG: mobile mystery protein [Gemmatimonadetes bacterium]|nr:mobile mystery protein [Gemmatimonadota bacterium]